MFRSTPAAWSLPLLFGAIPLPSQAGELPDIIVVLADDLGWEDVDAAQTPHLDQLRTEGVSFDSCFAMPNCSPGRYALLFGRWPRRDGMGSTVNTPDSMTPFRRPSPR